MQDPEDLAWESICDNCGKCCELIAYSGPLRLKTGLMCPFRIHGKCSVYEDRGEAMKSCQKVTPENVLELGLPKSCAYLRSEYGNERGAETLPAGVDS